MRHGYAKTFKQFYRVADSFVCRVRCFTDAGLMKGQQQSRWFQVPATKASYVKAPDAEMRGGFFVPALPAARSNGAEEHWISGVAVPFMS